MSMNKKELEAFAKEAAIMIRYGSKLGGRIPSRYKRCVTNSRSATKFIGIVRFEEQPLPCSPFTTFRALNIERLDGSG